MLLCQAGTKWRPRMDLRHQPPESESGALLVELQGYAKKYSREDLHLEPPPSQSGVHGSYTSGAVKMVAAFGIAPNSPRLQRGANLSQLHSRGSSAR